MKKFMSEFREFISKGNVLDLAVGVIIGGAFGAIVNALVDNIINPLIAMIGGTDVGLAVVLRGQTLDFGKFISAILNFLIIALVVFLIVKSANKAKDLVSKKEEEEEEATTKTCPFCKSEIDIEATRCPHCTSELPEETEE
ncbi:MAG: large conductance mechanosensitive channel protein MscL [Ruminococcaceae bacterium]|nr:large conductance mechanosensitive channel protein MscL [Oscillospiraceae bacterium]